MLVTAFAAGLAVFRAAGGLCLGITRGALLLRGTGCQKESGGCQEDGGETNHSTSRLEVSDHCFKQWLNYLLQACTGGGGGGAFCWQALRRAEAATRVRIAIFMYICVWVLTVFVRSSSTRLLAAGFCETNDNFHLCKQPNYLIAKMII
jgi:hypothetical protein